MEIVKNKLIKNHLNSKPIKLLVLFLLGILLYGVGSTNIYYANLTPFGVGLVFALCYIGFNGYVLGMLYFLVNMLCGFSLSSVLLGLNVGLVLGVMQFLTDSKKIKISKWKIFLCSLLSLIPFVICNVGDMKENLALLIAIILSVFFLYSCLCFCDATFGRGMIGKINLDEKICGAIILLVFSIGISRINIGIFDLGFFFASVIILVCTFLCRYGTTLVIGAIIGLGFSVSCVNPIFISLFVILSLSSIAFRAGFKYLSVIACIIAYVAFSLVFNSGIALGELFGVVAGGVVFAFIPIRFINSISGMFTGVKTIAVQNVFNSSKREVVSRIKDLSVVFSEMDNVYRGMVRGNLSDEKAKQMLKEETISEVCRTCSNRDRCFRSSGSFMDDCFDSFLGIAYEKGKALLIDIPEYMTTNCIKVNQLLLYLNNLIVTYKDYCGAVSNIDTSRMLIADQLSGVSKLLNVLSNEVDVDITLGNKYEKSIIENLAYAGVVCLECVIYERGVSGAIVSIIVKRNTINDKKIENIINKTMRTKFRIERICDSEIAGASNVVLKSKPNYDIAFGSSVVTKAGKIVSGDSHAIVPIGDGKYLMSICDGMGSGKSACDISRLTIKLIENFYRAGFDNDIILSSINKLLSLTEQENFSTIDLCVIDGRKNIYDFIKLGATSGYIKRDSGEVEVISSSGLPVGVLENIRPHITKKCISPMDIIILVSDGVSDILGDKLVSIIRNSNTVNPQNLSEQILAKALDDSGGVPTDDMTVVCVRVFESV